MADILSRADGYIHLKEDAALANRQIATAVIVTQTQKGGTTSKKPPPDLKKGDATTPVWKENRDKGFFRALVPIRSPVENRDQSMRCEFHNEVGHTTDECRSLCSQVKALICDGRLAHYVAQQITLTVGGTEGRATNAKSTNPYDLEEVQRIRIDGGSSADILFLNALNRMGLDSEIVQRSSPPLARFDGKRITPIGVVTLPVTAVDCTLDVNFIVVDSPSAYNAIMGRD
ncbi:hypothetical protein QJS10_CPB19g00543 [Acorus calamus]|uniref:Uncharacterized protein n=1 Tax=Acorus calamus TaxID=4465 RepID=A0AAV9CGY6_ACOCL|nr:hypothetical protein QJS10_CPB19g00543 [Acorus calamus]